MEDWVENNLDRLLYALGEDVVVRLDADESCTLLWLAECEPRVVANLASIFVKQRRI